jgi:hypothetical protein
MFLSNESLVIMKEWHQQIDAAIAVHPLPSPKAGASGVKCPSLGMDVGQFLAA